MKLSNMVNSYYWRTDQFSLLDMPFLGRTQEIND